jgi:hypothetical protein
MNQMTCGTFAEAAREYSLVLDRRHSVQTAMLLANDVRRAPSDPRPIFVLPVESEAHNQIFFHELKDQMRSPGDIDDSIRQQIEAIPWVSDRQDSSRVMRRKVLIHRGVS